MLFLVELDHARSGSLTTPEAGRALIEEVVLPTLERAEQLAKEKKILGGGPVVGRIALRLIIEADSSEHLDRMLLTLPLWPVAETRVTPLMTFAQRRDHARGLLESLAHGRQ
jgi:muconolactone delta-isomerase